MDIGGACPYNRYNNVYIWDTDTTKNPAMNEIKFRAYFLEVERYNELHLVGKVDKHIGQEVSDIHFINI